MKYSLIGKFLKAMHTAQICVKYIVPGFLLTCNPITTSLVFGLQINVSCNFETSWTFIYPM